MIAAVILAAGSGRRMGGPKAQLVLERESLLARAVRVAREAGCHPVWAVIGPWDPGPLEAVLLKNDRAEEGMASSLRLGIRALPPRIDRVLLLTVDQTAVGADLLVRLAGLSEANPLVPVACAYAGTVGIPAIFPRAFFPRLLALRGDQGAKAVLLDAGALSLPFPGGARDLDRPEDLEAFRR